MFQIKNRWSGKAVFECELSAEYENRGFGIKIGFAIKKAIKSDADLSGADLSGAVLRDAVLRDADLRGVPKIKNIHQAVYLAASEDGALNMTTWHCGTAHCRAGWVVTLAGEAGAAMEYCLGTGPAAALIYLASDPCLQKIPSWYSGNEEALEDMKRLADLEASA